VSYIINNPGEIWQLLLKHLYMTSVSLGIAIPIALLLALLIVGRKLLNTLVLGTLGILYTIPSIALIILLLPIFGLNATSVIVALVIYTQIILVRNFVSGLSGIDPIVMETAKSVGMNRWQQWWRIQFPLALPVMMAGLRIAALVAIAIATIGAWFGAGGLGSLLFIGIAEGRYDKILAGSIAVSALALITNWLLLLLQHGLDPQTRIERAEHRERVAESQSAVLTDQ
jgi:osmoprotectant transport system permease protein